MLAQPLVLGWTFDNGAIMVPVPKNQLLVGCEVRKNAKNREHRVFQRFWSLSVCHINTFYCPVFHL